MEDDQNTPKPGSPDAISSGCLCPIIDNHHGEGFERGGKRLWWTQSDCPLHGEDTIAALIRDAEKAKVS